MSTAPAPRIELPRVAACVVAAAVASALVLLFPVEPIRARLFDLCNLLAAALATGCAAWRARRSTQRRRWSWWAMAAGCGTWSTGQIGWVWLTLAGTYSYPSAADIAHLMLPVLASCALLLHPGNDGTPRIRRVLDALMTSLAIGLIIWRTALGGVLQLVDTGSLLTIAHLILDVLLLVLAVLTLTRARFSLGSMAVGLAAFAVADIAFVHDVALGIVILTPLDLGWGLGFASIALAALARPEGPRAPSAAPVIRRITAMLPYLPVAVALGLSLEPHINERSEFFDELTVTIALFVLVLVRQYLTLRQNWRLTAELSARESQLRHQAFHDGLTGLANRALFRDRLEHAVARHAQDVRPIAVLFLDLDDFKIVNDVLGHAVGDELLVQVSERLRAAVRPGDAIARLGGDEFALLLEDGRDPLDAAARISEFFEEPFDVGRQQIDVRVSVGVVESGSADIRLSADDLLACADTAMYAAKRSGKGRITAYSAGMSLAELEDRRLRNILREAIARGSIRLVYQPIVELDSGRTVALEALARWSHEGSDVPPTTFIAAASRVGVLAELTDTLLAEACAQLALWSTIGQDPARPLAVHVNVAPSQLVDPGFVRTATTLVHSHGLLPGQLVLEITESDLIADLTPAHTALAELRRAGVAISLDDFGVGNSSLSRLNDIEIDSVKIDRTFVDRIDTEPRRAAFLGALLRLAEDISLPVIAEGVESPGQLAELERLGCGLAQGYLLGRPASAAAAAAWLGPPAPPEPATSGQAKTSLGGPAGSADSAAPRCHRSCRAERDPPSVVAMPIDPQAQAFLAMVADAPPLSTGTVADNRAQLAAVVPLTGRPADLAEVIDTTLPGPAGAIPVRVYRPTTDPDLPAVAYFHGGGWMLCDLDTHDTTCRDIARHAEAVVVSVDYRRSPEAPFPAAYDDCLAVTRALLDSSAGLGTDPARVAVAGDSAGGNIAAAITQTLRGTAPALAHQVLIYPLVDAHMTPTPSYSQFAEGHFLTHPDIAYFLHAYAADADRDDPRLSPARAHDLHGLPPATIITAECDPLRDEGAAYADALTAAGVPVHYECFPGQVHPFVLLAGIIDAAHDARRLIGQRLTAAFTNPPSRPSRLNRRAY